MTKVFHSIEQVEKYYFPEAWEKKRRNRLSVKERIKEDIKKIVKDIFNQTKQ